MENSSALFVLSAVLVVGVVSAIGLFSGATGAAMTSQRGCWCQITPYTPYDHGLGTQYYGQSQVQFIAAHAGAGQLTDDWCNNRCQIMFRRNNNVVGQAAPFGSIRQPVV